jgi:hypothetical protein
MLSAALLNLQYGMPRKDERLPLKSVSVSFPRASGIPPKREGSTGGAGVSARTLGAAQQQSRWPTATATWVFPEAAVVGNRNHYTPPSHTNLVRRWIESKITC